MKAGVMDTAGVVGRRRPAQAVEAARLAGAAYCVLSIWGGELHEVADFLGERLQFELVRRKASPVR